MINSQLFYGMIDQVIGNYNVFDNNTEYVIHSYVFRSVYDIMKSKGMLPYTDSDVYMRDIIWSIAPQYFMSDISSMFTYHDINNNHNEHEKSKMFMRLYFNYYYMKKIIPDCIEE